MGVHINYDPNAPASTDVTIRTKNTPSHNLLVVSNNATDGYYAPRAKPVDNANSAITNAHAPYVVADRMEVVLAQCNALVDAVIVHLYYRD